MKRKYWILYVILPFFGSWLIDRVTKALATKIVGVKIFGFLGLTLHHNPGAMLGLFADLPAILRVVSLATGGAFLIFTFFIIQYLLPSQSLKLRAGMSLLIGGIIGNVTDRILHTAVIDFIFFKFGNWVSPVFNFADAIQWVGYGLIFVALVRENKLLWPESDLRKSYWINPRFQIRYCLMLVAFGASFFIISGTYCYTYFKVAIEEISGHNDVIAHRFLGPFIITLAVVTLGFLSMLFLVGLILSHRAAGPLYAFERFLEDLFSGKSRNLKLRAGDEFQHLEELSEKLLDRTNGLRPTGKKSS